MGYSHTQKYTHTFAIIRSAHSLVMVMDSTRQSSDKDAGAREVDHFTQIVFHTERNHRYLEHPVKQLDTHSILQPIQHNSRLNFPSTLGQKVIPSSTTHLLQQLNQDMPYQWCHLPGQGCQLLTVYILSQHCYFPYSALFESLMTAKGAHQKSPNSVPSLARNQPQPKFKISLKAKPQACGQTISSLWLAKSAQS